MKRLEREGIFKVRPLSWKIQTSANSRSVGINFDFLVLEEYGEDEDPATGEFRPGWLSWSNYDAHNVYGTYWIIGREGKPNQKAIEQLVNSIGWDGNLDTVNGSPPDVIVQVTVKGEPYNGETYYKAGWMNPGDYVPGPGGATPEEVGNLSRQFGSLLKAAAAGAKKATPAPAAKPKPPAPGQIVNPISGEPDDVPVVDRTT